MRGQAMEHVTKIKASRGKELLVIGSTHLTANLAQAGVLDELRVMIFPVVLGQGPIPF
jgi:dihydrofolate reductase